MQNNRNFTGNPSVAQAMKLAESKEGRQLYELLKSTNGDDLKKAMENAAAGNLEQVKNALSAMLSSPEAQDLLKKMGGK